MDANGKIIIQNDLTLDLPNELLVHIFSYYPASDDQKIIKTKSPHDHVERDRPPFWSTITQVCRRWRDVAIGTPCLWSNIVLTNESCVEEMVRRSRDLPLTVKPSKTFYEPNWGPVSQALRHIHRTAHLELIIVADEMPFIAPFLTENPAPLLESLSLSVLGSRPHHSAPSTWFCDQVPSLSRLTVRMLKLPPSANILHAGITHLSFHYLDHFTVTEFFDTLERMENLEKLELAYSCPRITPADSDLTRTVSLPNIRYISFLGVMSICAPIVTRLSIPPDAKVIIEVVQLAHENDPAFYGPALRDMVARLCGKERRWECATDSSKLTRLIIDESRFNGLRFRQFEYDDPKSHSTGPAFPFDDEPAMKYDFSVAWVSAPTYPKKAAARLLTEICAELPLEHVRTLAVSGRFHVSQNRWEQTFGHMKNVTELCISGDVAYGFMEAFEARDVDQVVTEEVGREPLEEKPTPTALPVSKAVSRPYIPSIFPSATRVRFETVEVDAESEQGGFPTFNSLRRGLLMRAKARGSSHPGGNPIVVSFHRCLIAFYQEENLRTIEGVRIVIGEEADKDWPGKSEWAEGYHWTSQFTTDSESMDSDLDD